MEGKKNNNNSPKDKKQYIHRFAFVLSVDMLNWTEI